MEPFWSGFDAPEEAAEGQEIVLTYRQQEDAEPVTLRYERALPACMRREEPAFLPDEGSRGENNPLNPPEKPRARWGVRLYVGISLLLIVCCLGVGIWYLTQYGWTVPGRGSAGVPPGGWTDVPYRGDGGYYYWDGEEDPADTAVSLPTYPTGGDVRLALRSAGDLPELTVQEIYERVTPSVVTVLGRDEMYASVGTGIIFSEDGYIMTNCHVIAGCGSCTVWVSGAYGVVERFEARVVGYDRDVDLAVLKIEAQGLPAAEFGISDDLQVGDPVYAIGNPLGVELRNTLTDGIVSAINRDVDVDGVTMTLIQTSAALNSGNSGGPLINQYGQVVGINTIKMMSQYDTIEGLGFAIPSSLAIRWVNELIEFGELQPQPVLGVTVNRIPQTMPDGTVGLYLEEVAEGLSGDRAGLRAGDYLVSFNGEPIVSYEQLLGLRRQLYAGDEVPVRVWRDGEYLDYTMIMMAE